MKHLRLLLLFFMTALFGGNAWAQDEKLDPTFNLTSKTLVIDETYTLTFGTESGVDIITDGEITLESTNAKIATIDGFAIKAVAAGVTTIHVVTTETDSYKAGEKDIELTVVKKDPVFKTTAINLVYGILVGGGAHDTMGKGPSSNYAIQTDGSFGEIRNDNENIVKVNKAATMLHFDAMSAGTTTVHIETMEGKTYKAGSIDVIVTVTGKVEIGVKQYSSIAEIDFQPINEWNIPIGKTNKVTTDGSYTNGKYNVSISNCNDGYYLYKDTYSYWGNYLSMGKEGATLTLPSFDKKIEMIEVFASGKANIYVGDVPVSTEQTIYTSGKQFLIDNNYQETGTQYSLKITTNGSLSIRKIRVCYKDNTEHVTLNSSGYATFCSAYPLDLSATDGFTAWQITDVNGNNITFEQVTNVVKGGTGVLLMGEPGASVNIKSKKTGSVSLNDNKLVGTVVPTNAVEGQWYGLSGNEFVKVNAGTVPAGKALLPASVVDGSGDIKSLNLIFTDETGIIETRTVNTHQAAEIFNLAGQRLQKAQKGVNIINGKKVLVR